MIGFGDFAVMAQQNLMGFDPSAKGLAGEGWKGFTDVNFLLVFLGRLVLATVLALLIAYHPKAQHNFKSLEEAQGPMSCVLYAVMAAIIGSAVLKFGSLVGFVVFGIGGLLRFRSNAGTATQTGRVILATLIGLCAGLDLPHVAVLSALFASVLIWIFNSNPTRCLAVEGIAQVDFDGVAAAYKSELESRGCKMVGENRNPLKLSLKLPFRGPSDLKRNEIREAVAKKLPDAQIGTLDWES